MEKGRPVARDADAAPCESFELDQCGRADTPAQNCVIGSRRKAVLIELDSGPSGEKCTKDWTADPRWALFGPKTREFFQEPKRWMRQQRGAIEHKGCIADEIMEALFQEASNSVAFLLAAYDMDLLQVAKFALNAKNSLGTLKPVVEDRYVLLARCVLVFQGMLAQIVTDNMVSLPLSLNQYLVTTTQDRYFRSWESFADRVIGQLAPPTVDEDQPMCAA